MTSRRGGNILMLEKIVQNIFFKPLSQDDNVTQEILKKSKARDNSIDKQREDAFNLLLEENISEEKNSQLARKKLKKHDDTMVLPLTNFAYTPRINQTNFLKIGQNKNNKTCRCSRCGNIMDIEESVEVNLEKRSTFVCSKCMNKEIADFLTYNYL
jgi:hypothetical protein